MSTPPQPQLRPAVEVQRAHDLILGVLLHRDIAAGLGETAVVLDQMACVLCWVLRHDHNPGFPRVLAAIEERMRDEGLVLFDSGTLNRPGEAS